MTQERPASNLGALIMPVPLTIVAPQQENVTRGDKILSVLPAAVVQCSLFPFFEVCELSQLSSLSHAWYSLLQLDASWRGSFKAMGLDDSPLLLQFLNQPPQPHPQNASPESSVASASGVPSLSAPLPPPSYPAPAFNLPSSLASWSNVGAKTERPWRLLCRAVFSSLALLHQNPSQWWRVCLPSLTLSVSTHVYLPNSAFCPYQRESNTAAATATGAEQELKVADPLSSSPPSSSASSAAPVVVISDGSISDEKEATTLAPPGGPSSAPLLELVGCVCRDCVLDRAHSAALRLASFLLRFRSRVHCFSVTDCLSSATCAIDEGLSGGRKSLHRGDGAVGGSELTESRVSPLYLFLNSFDWTNLRPDWALRLLLSIVSLPPSIRSLQGVLGCFSRVYVTQNSVSKQPTKSDPPQEVPSPCSLPPALGPRLTHWDAAYRLFYSLLVLNTDAHTLTVKLKARGNNHPNRLTLAAWLSSTEDARKELPEAHTDNEEEFRWRMSVLFRDVMQFPLRRYHQQPQCEGWLSVTSFSPAAPLVAPSFMQRLSSHFLGAPTQRMWARVSHGHLTLSASAPHNLEEVQEFKHLDLAGCCECGLCARGAVRHVTYLRDSGLPDTLRSAVAVAERDRVARDDRLEDELGGADGESWVEKAAKDDSQSSRGEGLLVSLLDLTQGAVLSLYAARDGPSREEWIDALHWSLRHHHFDRFGTALLPQESFNKQVLAARKTAAAARAVNQ